MSTHTSDNREPTSASWTHADRTGWSPAPPVGWYDPRQLVSTGLSVAASGLFADNADSRLLQPLIDGRETTTVELREIDAFDFLADTGDGFDGTFAVARWLAQPELVHGTVDAALGRGAPASSRASRLLVLGGDQVYPAPNVTVGSDARRNAYWARFVVPFELASQHLDSDRFVLAIPGNHDWYDNLVGFHDLFMVGARFGPWRTIQRRSYFCRELAHGVFLMATDMALRSDLDAQQLSFFRVAIDAMPPSARVILVHAEPHWVTEGERRMAARGPRARWASLWAKKGPLPAETTAPPRTRVNELEELLGSRLQLVIAGDLHHYRRHDAQGARERVRTYITAGGGGAFLHPTHGLHDVGCRGFGPRLSFGGFLQLARSFPSPWRSRRLNLRCLFFPFLNGWFLALSVPAYGLIALPYLLAARAEILAGRTDVDWWTGVTPTVVTLLSIVVAAFVGFTDTTRPYFRWLGGLLHGAVHCATAIAIPAGLACLVGWGWLTTLGHLGVAWLASALLGGFGGGLVLGVYLTFSLLVFGRHRNEAFSALRLQSYKNFLRIQISPEDITVIALGMTEVGPWSGCYNPESQKMRTREVAETERPHVIDLVRIPRKPQDPPTDTSS